MPPGCDQAWNRRRGHYSTFEFHPGAVSAIGRLEKYRPRLSLGLHQIGHSGKPQSAVLANGHLALGIRWQETRASPPSEIPFLQTQSRLDSLLDVHANRTQGKYNSVLTVSFLKCRLAWGYSIGSRVPMSRSTTPGQQTQPRLRRPV